MKRREAGRALLALYLGKGYAVETRGGEPEGPLLLRTFIQGDGDAIVQVSREALRQPEVCRAHLDRVAELGAAIGRFRRTVNWSVLGIQVGGGGVAAISCWEGWHAFLQGQAPFVLGWAAASLPCLFVRNVIRFGCGLYFRRKLRNATG